MAKKKKNWLEELQSIATQTVGPVQTNPATADDIVNQSAVQKVNQITELASKMYPEDMNSRFDFWKSRLDVGQLPQGGKQAYWSTYQTMHPEGIDGATRDFVTTTRKELDYIPGMAEKEFFLRERIAQTPDWARKQLEPILAEVSTTVANANYNKAQQVYASDLQTRVNAFLSNQQLDPDVAIDDHVNDMLKLEQMNLMEMASVMNGRVGIMKDGRSFVPAFGMTDSEQIVKDAAIAPSIEEQTVVQELARLPIKTAVANNVTSSRMKIKGQEETAKNIAQQYLRTGKYDMYSWDKAFSMMPDVPLQTKLSLGLRGEVEARRISTPQDVARSVFAALSTYGPKEEPATPPEPQEYKWELKDKATLRELYEAYYGKELTEELIGLVIARQKEVDMSDELNLPNYQTKLDEEEKINWKELGGARGTYNWSTDEIFIDPPEEGILDSSIGRDVVRKDLLATFLHEFSHNAEEIDTNIGKVERNLVGYRLLRDNTFEIPTAFLQLKTDLDREERKKEAIQLENEIKNGPYKWEKIEGEEKEKWYSWRRKRLERLKDELIPLLVPTETVDYVNYATSPSEFTAFTAETKAKYYRDTKKVISSKSSKEEILEYYKWGAKQNTMFEYLLWAYENPSEFKDKKKYERLMRIMFELPKQVVVNKVDTKTRMA